MPFLNNLYFSVVKHCFFRLRSNKEIVVVSTYCGIIIIFIIIIIIIIIIISVVYRTFTIWYLRQTTFCCSVLKPYGTCNVPSIDVKHFNTSTSPQCVCSAQCGCFVWFLDILSCFPSMLLWYFLNNFQRLPVTSVITGITFALHSTCTVFLLYYIILLLLLYWI